MATLFNVNATAPTKAERAELQVLEGLLEELPDEFLACRDMRHAWTVHADFYVAENEIGYRGVVIARELVCLRCSTGRHELYVQRKWGLDKIRNSYVYTSGYQLSGVPRGVKRSQAINDVQYRKAMLKVAALAKDSN